MAIIDELLPKGWNLQTAFPLLLALSTPFLLTWLYTTVQSWRAVAAAKRAPPGEKRPPTLPSTIPIVGHVVAFLQDGHGFLSNAVKHFGREIPVQVNLATISTYVVSGSETVSAFLKDPSRGLSPTARSLNIMEHAFGCPKHMVNHFKATDDMELEQQIHGALQGMLAGARLEVLAVRYQDSVMSQVLDAGIGDEWVELPDICNFVETHIFQAATRAIFGPYVVELNPDVAEHFWAFNRHVKSMFLGVPAWLNGAALKARDQMTADVKTWQRFADKHAKIDEIPEDVEWEPYYGSKSTRIRQQLLTKRGILDESARAAENLAFMWATNANSVPAACWFLLQTLHKPELEARVRRELGKVTLPMEEGGEKAGHYRFDVGKLTENALIQSVYAEVLRLNVAVLIVRQPTRDQYSLGGWHIKKDELISLSNATEMKDPDTWNAGTAEEPHPLDEFWEDRFIVYPDDATSGPLKTPKAKAGRSNRKGGSEPFFSLDGLAWSWLPYGGGTKLCPGRNFAKREILLTAAIMLTAFDIELLTDKLPSADQSVFGFGTMPPKGKVACRIRRRKT